MKKARVGINGIGRIGRAVLRINLKYDLFDVVAINDINPDIKNIAYLIKYDSTYGRLKHKVRADSNNIYIGEQKIAVFNQRQITDAPWDDFKVDFVIDASGVRANLELMRTDCSNVKNYIVTNAPEREVKSNIFGVNEDSLAPRRDKVISSSICDSIAFAPIIKIIEETHRISSGFLTTLHPWLSYQNLVDGPSVSWSQPGDIFSHYALGRASTQNLIPKSTSAVMVRP